MGKAPRVSFYTRDLVPGNFHSKDPRRSGIQADQMRGYPRRACTGYSVINKRVLIVKNAYRRESSG